MLPPSREEQERRLRGRGDPGDKVLARLRKAEQEEPVGVEQADHVVVNDELDRTVDEMLVDHRARTFPSRTQAFVARRRYTFPAASGRLHTTTGSRPWPRATTP